MLDIGWSEMAMIALLALIVIGPKDLPKVMRSIGQWTRKARNVASDFQSSLDDMVRESELDEARKTVESTRNFDVGRELESEVDPEGSIREEAGELDRSAREDTSSTGGGVVERESPTAPGHSVDAGKPASGQGGSSAKSGASKSGASKGGASKSGSAKSGASKGGASSKSKTAAATQSSPKTSDAQSGSARSGSAQSGSAKSGSAKSSGAKTGGAKSGGSKSGGAKASGGGTKTSARKTSGSKASG